VSIANSETIENLFKRQIGLPLLKQKLLHISKTRSISVSSIVLEGFRKKAKKCLSLGTKLWNCPL
jgi:hypothetical protein